MSNVTTTATYNMSKCLITKTFVLIEQTFRSNYQNIQIMYNVTHTPIWHIRSLCNHFKETPKFIGNDLFYQSEDLFHFLLVTLSLLAKNYVSMVKSMAR